MNVDISDTVMWSRGVAESKDGEVYVCVYE